VGRWTIAAHAACGAATACTPPDDPRMTRQQRLERRPLRIGQIMPVQPVIIHSGIQAKSKPEIYGTRPHRRCRVPGQHGHWREQPTPPCLPVRSPSHAVGVLPYSYPAGMKVLCAGTLVRGACSADGGGLTVTEDPRQTRGNGPDPRTAQSRSAKSGGGSSRHVPPGLPCAPADGERERGRHARYRPVDAQNAPLGAASMVIGTAYHDAQNGGSVRSRQALRPRSVTDGSGGRPGTIWWQRAPGDITRSQSVPPLPLGVVAGMPGS
jgi:hypothetical protein